jgi:uncharacterized OsmC-like protein
MLWRLMSCLRTMCRRRRIVLKESVDEQTIQRAIREAAEQTCSNPTYQ